MRRSDDGVDLLLLNASNYPRVPIFPYAFVQVAEVARRHGVTVATNDLLGTPTDALRATLARLVARHRPRMIGLHLRQLDSLFVEEYRGYRPLDAAQPPFFPAHAAAAVVEHLRALTDVPVVLGGLGFTANPRAVFRRVRPDLGVIGEPDGFFARFHDVLQRAPGGGDDVSASVANLMTTADAVPARSFFPPAPGPEYTDDTVAAIERFYGARAAAQQAIPVEVMRGCPFRCSFCCEPAAKGSKPAVRDLDAVLADIDLLGAHGLSRIWLVCSELNVAGPDLALALAERIIKLDEKTGRRTRFHAFALPHKMSDDTWRTLLRAGFRGGFNTFLSLDDDNLRRARIPHRAKDAIDDYEAQERVAKELGLAGDDDLRSRGTLALFLGNSFAEPRTVARSVRALHERGLLESARVAVVMSATRVFEVDAPDAARTDNEVVTFDVAFDDLAGRARPQLHPRGAGDIDLALPTFELPRALVAHFGSRAALEDFLAWVESTLLSRAHEAKKAWARFAAAWARDLVDVAALAGAPAPVATARSSSDDDDTAARRALLDVFARHPAASARGLAALGLDVGGADASAGDDDAMTRALALPVYDALAALYRRHGDDDVTHDAALARVAAACAGDAVAVLAARFFLYARNIVLSPAYRAALFDDDKGARA